MEGITDLYEKLRVLAEGAKYDASCSTSGVGRNNNGRMGNAACSGICHSWSADGRCISLLKVLMSNACSYDCVYCVNRRSADAERATFEPEELARLVMEFYRRNYIEGLFLSSAVLGTPDNTAERMLRCLELLRNKEGFSGYIHAKLIPGTSPELVYLTGLLADRVSVNIELPSADSLGKLAPQKNATGIFQPMKQITNTIRERRKKKGGDALWDGGVGLDRLDTVGSAHSIVAGRRGMSRESTGMMLGDPGSPVSSEMVRETGLVQKSGRFAPAGQTTQMMVGASPESDLQIVRTTEALYRTFRLKRVYYSAYIPLNESPLLPALFTAPPLKREHRLYQADWLLRFYGFRAEELLTPETPFFDQELDPKMMWALRHIELFPLEINKASYEELLRIPGIGEISAHRIMRQRRFASVKFEDLQKMGTAVKRARFFITCGGRYYGQGGEDPARIRSLLLEEEALSARKGRKPDGQQISMFG